jgi:transcriptional regulator with XRE-family HTH domain
MPRRIALPSVRWSHPEFENLLLLAADEHGFEFASKLVLGRTMSLARTVALLRKTCGLTLKELHDRTGLSTSYLHGIEHERFIPGTDKLELIVRDGLAPDDPDEMVEALTAIREYSVKDREEIERAEEWFGDRLRAMPRTERRELIHKLRQCKPEEIFDRMSRENP